MKKFLEIFFSGIGGVVLTLICQYLWDDSQSFTFIYNGDEVVVTESTYTELVEDNKKKANNILSLETEIQDLKNKLEMRNSEENILLTIEKATDYWNNSEYVQALTLLKKCDINSSDISALYHEYSEEYCSEILKEVDNLISERKYNEAKELLSSSKSLVESSVLLEKKLTEMNNNTPIKLSNLKISTSRFFELKEDMPIEDTIGNKYLSENLFIIHAEREDDYGYASFYLGKKYTSLSGLIAISDLSEDRDDYQLKGQIEIYSKTGEEYKQLYSSPILSRMTSPIPISEVNLKDADWLEIRYYNKDVRDWYRSLDILLSDFMIFSD